MKRILVLLLSLSLLASFAACSQGEPPVTSAETVTQATPSTPKERFQAAVNATERLQAAVYETTVTGLSAPIQVKTLRVRKGYEGFALSRVSHQETLIYADGVAYLSSSLGRFRAEASTRLFNAYLEEKTFPVGCLPAESFLSVTEEGNTLVATEASDALKARFSLLAEGLQISEVKDTVTLNARGHMEKEVVELKGVQNGASLRLTITTEYSEDGEGLVFVKAPAEADSYLSVADLRLPDTVQRALVGLHSSPQLQLTAVTLQKLVVGNEEYVSSRETTLYQKGSGASFHHYHTVQELLETPEKQDFTLLQVLVENGICKETFYELTQAELLRSQEKSSDSVSSEQLMEGILPALSDLATLTLSQAPAYDTVSFSLSADAQKEYAKKIAALFEESGMTPVQYTSLACSGTVSVDRKTGEMISLAFRLEGEVEDSSGAKGTVQGQYSINVDQRENVTVPSLQIPTPTVPGQQPEGEVPC